MLHSRADQLVSVNGNSLLDMSVDDALLLLSPSELSVEEIKLKVVRPKRVDALMTLLSDDTHDSGSAYGMNRLVEIIKYTYLRLCLHIACFTEKETLK